jgi:uncharacterized damage-inducible protein DinB
MESDTRGSKISNLRSQIPYSLVPTPYSLSPCHVTIVRMIIDDLYRYNSWANRRIVSLCDDLPNPQLDEPRAMGFGSLRNTVFHILAAEEIWLERWTGVPWRPFPMEAAGLSIGEMARRLDRVATDRQSLIDRERPDRWQRVCEYKDSKGNTYRNPLDGLLLHVANHGTYHRAQALNYLKRLGRTVPGGIDYIFYRLAKPQVAQEQATADSMRQFGLEVATGASPPLDWDATLIRNYFTYGDWCNGWLLDLAAPLDAAALDRDFGIGPGTIRATLLHIADAERWWLSNWTTGPTVFDKAPLTTPIADLRGQWSQVIAGRNRFIDSLDDSSAKRVVTPLIGPMSVRVPVIESLVQLCGHGTHHRAQLINMLRQSDVTARASDYSIWLREVAAT